MGSSGTEPPAEWTGCSQGRETGPARAHTCPQPVSKHGSQARAPRVPRGRPRSVCAGNQHGLPTWRGVRQFPGAQPGSLSPKAPRCCLRGRRTGYMYYIF